AVALEKVHGSVLVWGIVRAPRHDDDSAERAEGRRRERRKSDRRLMPRRRHDDDTAHRQAANKPKGNNTQANSVEVHTMSPVPLSRGPAPPFQRRANWPFPGQSP